MIKSTSSKKVARKPSADYFISYSAPDLQTARWFRDWIIQTGQTARLIEPGEGGGKSFVSAMNEGIETSDRLLAVYTQNYQKSGPCIAELEAMWRRDPDGQLGRILIARLSDVDVPALFATRDYWDFTKIKPSQIEAEFLRRIQELKPISARQTKRKKPDQPALFVGQKTNTRKSAKTSPRPFSASNLPNPHPSVEINISGNPRGVKVAGRDLHENHYYAPKKEQIKMARRGDEINNAQAAELLNKLREWGRAEWECSSQKPGKTEQGSHASVQERFKKRMKIPRYEALEAASFGVAMSYIRQQMGKLMPKLEKKDPDRAKKKLIASIQAALKSSDKPKEIYYLELATRLKIAPFSSITILSIDDLKRVKSAIQRDKT